MSVYEKKIVKSLVFLKSNREKFAYGSLVGLSETILSLEQKQKLSSAGFDFYNDKDEVAISAQILEQGGIISFPTDTLVGLLVLYDKSELQSVKKLHKLKARSIEKPFLCLVSSDYNINSLIDSEKIPPENKNLLHHWPVKTTFILPKLETMHYPVGKSIGIRRVFSGQINSLLCLLEKPVFAPSANLVGEKPLHLPGDIATVFAEDLDAIFYNFEFCGVDASRIVDLSVFPVDRLR